MLANIFENLGEILFVIPAVLVAIIMHELAHGYVSYLLGDPTPKESGRLTLNPIKHLDPIGTICLILFRFGWAKPVMVDPRYYKNPKWGMFLTALAGPLMNLGIAIVSFFISAAVYRTSNNVFFTGVHSFFMIMGIINIGFFTFNMLPIPPLDGSKIFGAILPKKTYFDFINYRYGMFIIWGIVLVSSLISVIFPDLGGTTPITFLVEKIYELIAEPIYRIFGFTIK